ncbi:MAG: DUF4129 domain-containing transglutaminase family protein [Chloroflexota bacterium]
MLERPVQDEPELTSGRPRPDSRLWRALNALKVPEGWLAFLGFVLAAEGLAGGISAAYWQPGLTSLPWLAVLAIALGYVLNRRGLPRLPAHLLALLVGFWVAVRMVALGFLRPDLGWQAHVVLVAARLVDWIDKSLAGQIVQDDLLVALSVATFLFGWVYLAYWAAFRAHLGWLAAALLGAALLVNTQYKPSTAGYLVPWAAGSLLLALRLNLFHRQTFYQRLGFTGWRRGQRLSTVGGVLMAALATLAFAAAPSSPVNKQLNELWNRINGPIGQAQRIYNSLGQPQQVPASEVRGSDFSPQLRFLGPFRPGDQLVMKVASNKPRYEQGLIFDHYGHSGWTNTRFDQFETNSSPFATLTASRDTARDRSRRQIAQRIVQVLPKGALLFAAPQPLGASIGLRGDGFGDLRATRVVHPNEVYTSASLESTATVEDLQAAGGPIPTAVRAPFLQLPSGVPSRVKQLAETVTSGHATAFDKATALQNYIRTFPYDVNIPAPPPGRDGVDWFLFDMRKGYCDYDSSAMAVMLRTIGIPARVVSGYAPGQFDPADGTYHVTERQAHTWTQAYFPGYGWIDFEPTPDNPTFPRVHSPRQSSAAGVQSAPTPTAGPAATPTPGPGPGASSPKRGGTGSHSKQPSFPWPLALLVLAAAGAGLWLWLRRQPAVPGARLAYARLMLTGALLGLRPRRWQTPREFGRELQSRRGFHPKATETVTDLYGADRYGQRPLPDVEHQRAWQAWQRIRRGLFRTWKRR